MLKVNERYLEILTPLNWNMRIVSSTCYNENGEIVPVWYVFRGARNVEIKFFRMIDAENYIKYQ